MNKTKIEWCDYTWNPIKGLCPVGCWYCYARAIYKRFKLDERLCLDITTLWEPNRIKAPSRIFVCSTMEIFHPSVDKAWRDWIFTTIKSCFRHTFIILTKMPERIDRPMPDNVWLGTSVTGERDMGRMITLGEKSAQTKFLSIEPLLEDLGDWTFAAVDWIIIGRLTGHGKKYDPGKEWIQNILDCAAILERPVFMKNNLREIWGKPLRQEYPR
jgi:protein gp37